MPTVTGDIKQIAGTDVTSGLIRFTATTPIVQDRNARTTRLGPAEHVVSIGSTGEFTTTLPATGEGWVYEARIQAYVNGQEVRPLPTLLLPVPEGGADLADAGIKGQTSGQVVIRQLVTAGELDAAVTTALVPFENGVAEAKAAARESRDFAYRAEQTVGGYEPRIKGIEAMAGLTPEEPVDGQTSNLVSNSGTLTGQAVRTAASSVVAGHAAVTGLRDDLTTVSGTVATLDEELGATRDDLTARLQVFEQQTPEKYGAVPGDSADSTAAILNWLRDGWSVLPPRTYKITGGLSLALSGLRLVGNGATLLVAGNDSAQSRVLSITGNDVEVTGLHIAGAPGAKIRGGIYVYGDNAKVQNNRVTDLVSELESRAIHVEGNGGHIISGNKIHNISATGNTTEGDGTGMARAIVVYNTGHATMPTLVASNIITDILGEEGDGITILASDSVAPRFESSKTTVVGNVVDNCSRRMVKVQGSDVDVLSNTLRDSKRGTPGNTASALNVYASGSVNIKGNVVHYSDLGSSINVQGAQTGNKAEDVTISGNSIFAATGSGSTGIYVDYTDRAVAIGNDIHGGFRGIGFGNVSSGAITGNVIERLTVRTNAYAAAATSTCTRIAMTNNTDLSVGIFNTFRNDSTGGIGGATTGNNLAITA